MQIAQLYIAACQGEPLAEEELFRQLLVRFKYLVNHRVYNRQDTEEIVQSAMLVVVKEFRSLAPGQRFEPWAYKVLNYRLLSYMKARRRSDNRLAGVDAEELLITNSPSDHQLREKLRSCLAKVRQANKSYARILALHFQGYTTDEICSKLDMTPNNLYVSLSRARAKLSHCLDGKEIEDA